MNDDFSSRSLMSKASLVHLCLALVMLWAHPLTAQSIPPLTEAQQIQLATAQDGGALVDEAAFYPLLDNSLQWPPGSEAGAMIPDYAAIQAQPVQHRGQLFLIEGILGGPPRDMENLARPGPWEGKLQQWVLITQEKPEQLAVVYLTQPALAPPVGSKLRVPARFFKVWTSRDRQGVNQNYLTFVGQSAAVLETGTGTANRGLNLFTTMFLAVLLGMIGLVLARRWVIAKSQARTAEARSPFADDLRRLEELGIEEEPLPEDPVEALKEMQRRKHG